MFLSGVVGYGYQRAGTTSPLKSYLPILHEPLISQPRWTHLSDCRLFHIESIEELLSRPLSWVVGMLAHFVRQLRHISIPLRRNHSSTSECFLDFPFLFYSTRVEVGSYVVV